VALVATALFLIPTPYQVLLPGPVTDVQRLIEPNPRPGKGALYLTTIYSDPASVGEWLYARINPEAGIVPREEARPRNVDDKQYQKLLVSMMDESKVAAKVVALREAGYDVTVTGQGAQVRELAETSKAKGLLQAGDVIVAADGEPVATSTDLIALLQARRPGDTVRLEIRREGTGEGAQGAEGAQTLSVDVPRRAGAGQGRDRRPDPPLRVPSAARGGSEDEGRRGAQRGPDVRPGGLQRRHRGGHHRGPEGRRHGVDHP
jgi:PDZ domain-containing secreted protein